MLEATLVDYAVVGHDDAITGFGSRFSSSPISNLEASLPGTHPAQDPSQLP